jgi:hypothetical protein
VILEVNVLDSSVDAMKIDIPWVLASISSISKEKYYMIKILIVQFQEMHSRYGSKPMS